MIYTYKVNGMSCGGCAKNIEKILSGINGVVSAKVDIVTSTARVEMKEDIGLDSIGRYFKDTHYTLVKM